MKSRLLLVIDVQAGFINDGTRHVVPRIESLLREHASVPVAFTRFVNSRDSSFVRFQQWKKMLGRKSIAIVPELRRRAVCVFDKCNYSGTTPEFMAHLRQHGIRTVYLCGLDTDGCVLATAFALFDHGIRPVILLPYCASSSAKDHHRHACAVMKRSFGSALVLGDRRSVTQALTSPDGGT
ncbi:cysteine hydrolase family protein [Horticoccus sp. 23ND18S-11]|uniref:cysteine hydrolase family protein n=1 Tax=Horticoccus sp. 23ND18S-11 TaxID=3391832 RepID=UPI0039C95680